MDFERALDVMLEYGVTGAELRCLWDINIADLDEAGLSRAKSALDERGMTVTCISSPLLKCNLPRFEAEIVGDTHGARTRSLDDQRQLFRKCVRLARFFGTNLIRVFSFWKSGELTPEIEAEIVVVLREFAELAEEENITLALENEYACFTGTGEDTARVLRAVGSPALKAIWDPGNAVFAGENAYPDGYEAIKEYIVHVHVKDVVERNGELRFVCIGEGEIGYEEQLKALKDDGFSGFISLETHVDVETASEEPSKKCLATLNAMIAAL
jgi:sugar phosphate isomerase/epimerase